MFGDECNLFAALIHGDNHLLLHALLNDHQDNDKDDSFLSDSVSVSSDKNVQPGRGHCGPRSSKAWRSHDSVFWKDHIVKANSANPDDMDDNTWHEDSHLGKTFCRCFALSHVPFDSICCKWNKCGEHQVEHDMVHWPQIDARLLTHDCFHILAKGTTFDIVDKATRVSYQSTDSFLQIHGLVCK